MPDRHTLTSATDVLIPTYSSPLLSGSSGVHMYIQQLLATSIRCHNHQRILRKSPCTGRAGYVCYIGSLCLSLIDFLKKARRWVCFGLTRKRVFRQVKHSAFGSHWTSEARSPMHQMWKDIRWEVYIGASHVCLRDKRYASYVPFVQGGSWDEPYNFVIGYMCVCRRFGATLYSETKFLASLK